MFVLSFHVHMTKTLQKPKEGHAIDKLYPDKKIVLWQFS